jgi:hypothetical protein
MAHLPRHLVGFSFSTTAAFLLARVHAHHPKFAMPDDDAFRLDPSAACDACGCFGAYHFEGETLCADCYAGRGSCCSAEFSGHDPGADDARRAAPKPASDPSRPNTPPRAPTGRQGD